MDTKPSNLIELKSLVSELLNYHKKANQHKDIITSSELMKWLKISRQTLHRWKEKGILTSYMLGGTLFFKRSEVMESIEQGKIITR